MKANTWRNNGKYRLVFLPASTEAGSKLDFDTLVPSAAFSSLMLSIFVPTGENFRPIKGSESKCSLTFRTYVYILSIGTS